MLEGLDEGRELKMGVKLCCWFWLLPVLENRSEVNLNIAGKERNLLECHH